MKWHMAANVLIAGSVNGEVFMWKLPDGDCKVLQGYGYGTEAGVILPDGNKCLKFSIYIYIYTYTCMYQQVNGLQWDMKMVQFVYLT